MYECFFLLAKLKCWATRIPNQLPVADHLVEWLLKMFSSLMKKHDKGTGTGEKEVDIP